MKRSNVLALLAIGSLVGSIHAQTQVQVDLPSNYVQNTVLGKNGLPSNVIGSPYFIETFNYGSVLVEGSESYKALMRYNAYTDEIEMKNSDNTITALMKRDYIKARFNNETYGIYAYDDGKSEKQGYFLVKSEVGDFVLLQRRKKMLREGKQATSSYSSDTPPSFDDLEKFYLKVGEEVAQPIRLKKKDILNALPSAMKSKAETYVKENKTKLKTEMEVVNLLNHLANQ